MENNKKIDRFAFMAETFLVDRNGRVRPTTLCNYMLTCGGRHGEARGFGATTRLGWVLARLALHIERTPQWRERFFIETWIKNLYHGFTDRCVRVIDEDGNEIASMLATFAMIDLKTRSAVDLNGDIGLRINECIEPNEPLALRRIPSISREAVEEVTFKRKPRYSDIDINGHMNSIRSLDHILDALPIEFIDNNDLTDFVVAYMKEGEADEELSYGIKKLGEGHFLAQVTKENGTAASRCELRFKKR
jgi:acyl-ACP thioesterase